MQLTSIIYFEDLLQFYALELRSDPISVSGKMFLYMDKRGRKI